jgi:uracil phosphoribosyltransferase
MDIVEINHPVLDHKLSLIRAEQTDSPTFRRLVDEAVTLLAFEATRHLATQSYTVQTPLATTQGTRLASPAPIIVPVLRAGLGMLDAMTRMLPVADVGFLGAVRDETTLQVSTYGARLPGDLIGRQVLVLDPMLATGHTLSATLAALQARGCRDLTCVCLLAAPEGLDYLRDMVDPGAGCVRIITAHIDQRLNENGYIVPGLGDAGDRLYGAPE